MERLATSAVGLASPLAALPGLEDVYRIAFEHSAAGISITAPSGQFLQANKAFCDFVGYSRDELLARRITELVHPDDRLRAGGARDRMLRGEISEASLEQRYAHKSGLAFWALVTTTLVRDAEGEATCFIAQVIDIGDRKLAEDALRSAEARFRTLIGAMQDVILVVDGDGRIVDVAPSATDRVYRAPSDLLGKTLHDVHAKERADEFLAAVRQALRTRAPAEVSYDVDIRGERFWFDATLLPHPNRRVVWVARDVTQRRKTEQALRDSEEQLRQAQKMEAVGQLAGGIAHDFNNLLMAIMSNAELATMELEHGSPSSGHVDEIMSAARRARSLTQQLLAFSRKQVLQPRVMDLNSVARESEIMVRRLIGTNIAMDVRLDHALGRVRADPGQLAQVLINLVVNARDAMPNGGRLEIVTSNETVSRGDPASGTVPGEYVSLRVKDNGIGMPLDVLARVFEPFFTTKPPGYGTGLGMSTAYGIVKQSGGSIAVESAVGAGTTFTVRLPREKEIVPEEVVPATKRAPTGSGTILLVEDDSAVRDAARRMLGKYGFTVIEARDGRDALDQFSRTSDSVDAVLTDVVMPAMGGAELVRLLRRSRPDLRVVFMSGYTKGTLELSEMDDPSTRFLHKPFSSEQLVGALRELLQAQNST